MIPRSHIPNKNKSRGHILAVSVSEESADFFPSSEKAEDVTPVTESGSAFLSWPFTSSYLGVIFLTLY